MRTESLDRECGLSLSLEMRRRSAVADDYLPTAVEDVCWPSKKDGRAPTTPLATGERNCGSAAVGSDGYYVSSADMVFEVLLAAREPPEPKRSLDAEISLHMVRYVYAGGIVERLSPGYTQR